MTRRNDFIEILRRAGVAKQPAREKPISAMTEAELQAEGKRVRSELRRTQGQEVRAGREEIARQRTTLGDVLRAQPRRRPLK
jgi:hypothetical protein